MGQQLEKLLLMELPVHLVRLPGLLLPDNLVHRTPQRLFHLGYIDGLLDIIDYGQADGAFEIIRLHVTAHKDQLASGNQPHHLLRKSDSVHLRHPDIRQYDIRTEPLHDFQRFLSVHRLHDLVYPKFLPGDLLHQALPGVILVIRYQYLHSRPFFIVIFRTASVKTITLDYTISFS